MKREWLGDGNHSSECFWITVTLYWPVKGSSEIGQWIIVIATIAAAVSLGYIVVRTNYSKIKYSDSQTDDKKLKELVRQYNVPVE